MPTMGDPRLNRSLNISKDRGLFSMSEKKFRLNPDRFWKDPSPERLSVQFCHDTSLHGLKYVGQRNRHCAERIFWLTAFVGGIVLATYLISDVWYKYKSNPVFVAFAPKELPISKLPFPAITICNMNRILKSVATEIQENATSEDSTVREKALEEIRIMDSICESSPSLAKLMLEGENHGYVKPKGHDGTKVIDFLYKASQPCENMIQRCFLGKIEFPCNESFFPVITESGMCCSLNMLPNSLLLKYPSAFESDKWQNQKYDSEYRTYYNEYVRNWSTWDYTTGFIIEEQNENNLYPYSPSSSGKSNSLAFLLYPDVKNYYCTTGDSTGFLMSAHNPIEMPHPVDYGMVIPPGTEVYASLNAEITSSETSIADVAISSRCCYFAHEYPLRYFHAYTDSNCQDECVSNFTLKECGCVFYYHPRDNYTRICDETDLDCTDNVTVILQLTIDTICDSCLTLCNELDYQISSSLSVLQNHSMMWPLDESGNISRSIWYEKPVTILNVYFGKPTAVSKVRKRLFESTDLIANVGGLLGLCLGFSGLSAIEVAYFCTLRMWFQKRRLRRAVVGIAGNFINALKRMTGEIPEPDYRTNIVLDKNIIPVISRSNGMPNQMHNLKSFVKDDNYIFPA